MPLFPTTLATLLTLSFDVIMGELKIERLLKDIIRKLYSGEYGELIKDKLSSSKLKIENDMNKLDLC